MEHGSTPLRRPFADVNLLPKTIELAQARATLGEICGALREVWGAYEEPMIV
jgi:methylmalonyl-CoA mutase N-terminal domain/subunit